MNDPTSYNSNVDRLREAANSLLTVVGNSEEKAKAAAPFLDTLAKQLSFQFQTQPQIGTYTNLQHQMWNMISSQGSFYNLSDANQEKRRIAMRLRGFDTKTSPVVDEITKRFGSDVKHGELQNIAQAISEVAGIKLDRDAKRRKIVLFKWFEENWNKIQPYLDYVVIENVDNFSNHGSSTQQPDPQTPQSVTSNVSTISTFQSIPVPQSPQQTQMPLSSIMSPTIVQPSQLQSVPIISQLVPQNPSFQPQHQ